MKAAVQVLKQADELKAKVNGDILNDNEAWTCHQKLQNLYQQLLVMDLEYALDKKVEQDLWNYVFKNQISNLQSKAKDKKNPQRSESQGSLAWFLEAASGFYLQLLQELCDAFDLDLPFRRKGSVYGIIKGSKPVNCKIAPPQKSSCLYVCQHCLVHLGDIARYRSQSLQAETFYRHAAQLVPSNGQPYNQLAILEAAKGEKLSTVFYYVRSIAVKHPFPVASTNLQKMFSKIASDELCIEGKAKLSVYDYINTFLQFHSLIHMASDLDKASKLLRVLSSNLSTLVATESLSSWKLIQMTAINLFAVAHATRTLECGEKRENDNEQLSEDEHKVFNLMLELLASMLNGLLLLVYTMKDEQNLRDYYALPTIKLILDWIRQDVDTLQSQPFSQKLQIWPSLGKLLNGIQPSTLENFDVNKYQDVPLPEDWDLQCFLPLSKAHKQYKFKEATPRLTEEEENKLRAYRLVSHGYWICEQEVVGTKLMSCHSAIDGSLVSFEAVVPEAPSSDVIMQLEEVSVSKSARNGHLLLDSHNDSSSNSVSSQEAAQSQEMKGDSNHFTAELTNIREHDKVPRGVMREKGNKLEGKVMQRTIEEKNSSDKNLDKIGIERKENTRPGGYGRERKTRQNVAMQTIMQKKTMSGKSDSFEENASLLEIANSKPRLETRQVTFKTPSPSPPASSEGTPPLTATPPQNPPAQRMDFMTNFPPLHSVYSQVQPLSCGNFLPNVPQQYNMQSDSKPAVSYPANRMAMSFPVQNHNTVPEQMTGSPPQSYPPSLPATGHGYHPSYGAHPPTHQGSEFAVPGFRNQLKDAMQQTANYSSNRVNNLIGGISPQQQFLYGYGSGHATNGPTQPMSPSLQKQQLGYGEAPACNQQMQWFPQTAMQMQGMKNANLESQLLAANQTRPSQVPPQVEAAQPVSAGSYQIFAPQHQAQPQRGQIPENIVFQMQATPSMPYNFQSQLPPRFSQSHLPPHHLPPANTLSSVAVEPPPMMTSVSNTSTNKMCPPVEVSRVSNDSPAGNGEVITNTYSLFNSPWSSGLNLSPTNNSKEAVPVTTRAPSPGTTTFANFTQSALQQSLWSGPGPSPLERLLEQQKQKRDTAPQ